MAYGYRPVTADIIHRSHFSSKHGFHRLTHRRADGDTDIIGPDFQIRIELPAELLGDLAFVNRPWQPSAIALKVFRKFYGFRTGLIYVGCSFLCIVCSCRFGNGGIVCFGSSSVRLCHRLRLGFFFCRNPREG